MVHGAGFPARVLSEIPRLFAFLPALGAGRSPCGAPGRPRLSRVGFVTGLAWEASTLAAAAPSSRIHVACRGPGPAAAATAAREALAAGCGLLVSWGSAGGLGELAAGDVVVASRVVPESGPAHDCGADVLSRWTAALPAARTVTVASVSRPLVTADDKRALRRRTGAAAVDMESVAVARAAEQAGIDWVCVRAIVDAAGVEVPPAALAGMDGPNARPGRVLAALLQSPRQLGAVLRLAGAARRARHALVACARAVPLPSIADP